MKGLVIAAMGLCEVYTSEEFIVGYVRLVKSCGEHSYCYKINSQKKW